MPDEIKITALVQDRILEQIADKKRTRNDIAETYVDILAIPFFLGDTIKKVQINRAIIKRWSRSGLRYILGQAWKQFELKNKNVLINSFYHFRGCSKDW